MIGASGFAVGKRNNTSLSPKGEGTGEGKRKSEADPIGIFPSTNPPSSQPSPFSGRGGRIPMLKPEEPLKKKTGGRATHQR